MSKPIIEVRGLSKRYWLGAIGATRLREELAAFWARATGATEVANEKEFWALKDVSFEVHPGEVVGVIGRNGAGKSTLLKVLSRITDPTSGEAIIRGRVASLLEVGTGFHPDLTGRENVYLNGAILGMSRSEVRQKFDEIVAFAELEKFIDTPVKRYSSGMYVRLAFAIAAHLEPEILIVDEVLAVGDYAFQQKCLGKMQEVSHEHGRTVLFVSHNMAALRSLCTRGIVFNKGGLIFDSTADEATQFYLTQGQAPEGVVEWGEDFMPNTEGFRFLRAWVEKTNNAEISPTVHHNEPFSVCIEYSLSKPLSGLKIGFLMQTKDGITMCGSNDEGSGDLLRESGRYISKCSFPSYVFNEGQYQVQFGSETSQGVLDLLTPFCLSFCVDDLEKHGSARLRLPGVARPKLKWNISSCARASVAAGVPLEV